MGRFAAACRAAAVLAVHEAAVCWVLRVGVEGTRFITCLFVCGGAGGGGVVHYSFFVCIIGLF